MNPPLIQQLALRNYKSVAACTLELRPLTLFVGRNGAGKSNILDALRFVSDALNATLEFAMRERGGIDQVRRKSLKSRPPDFSVGIRVTIPDGYAKYHFKIGPVNPRGFVVKEETCSVVKMLEPPVEYTVREGAVERWTLASRAPSAASDQLYLVAVSGEPAFHPVFDGLKRMAFHNLNPDAMKLPRKPEPGNRLAHDGHNLASVVKELKDAGSHSLDRAAEYLRAIGVPISAIKHKQLGAFETVEFVQKIGDDRSWTFDAASMSDGTLRSLGILVSVLSSANGGSLGPTFVGIEEPESALHPAAAGALVDALFEGAERTQIAVTCHSPDLLEHPDLDPSSIFSVVNEDGFTKVAPLSETTKRIIRDHLCTAGELQRQDQLTPDEAELKRQEASQGYLFDDIPA